MQKAADLSIHRLDASGLRLGSRIDEVRCGTTMSQLPERTNTLNVFVRHGYFFTVFRNGFPDRRLRFDRGFAVSITDLCGDLCKLFGVTYELSTHHRA